MSSCLSYSLSVAALLFVIVCFIDVAQGQYEDVRCKCVCPSVTPTNGTATRKIFVQSFHDPARCKCEHVVDAYIISSQSNFCERCDCQWQRRNTTTIKVVVIIIICIVSLLFLYMLFLLCLDPLMSYRQNAYVEQRNDSINAETRSSSRLGSDVAESSSGRSTGVISRVKHRMAGEQEKWKGTVQNQRKNIYDEHTMLN